ncbi:hypothetical protein IB237_23390 [Agrobacterium sp. AGB01]|uniref:hypothetical protein n=1 Tax=Agrobacterium sp. AGB01 TaxID=2769302 RepID=UPI00177D189E|nr:hypothetical protein [Agrobacterium sp. AGB01]MBD9390149.1 hypothetical protein [Agrobacterium sp. AGB01]
MTEIAVFKTFMVPSNLPGKSARAEFALTPQSFAAMMPHQQTELCLLAHEAGYSVRKLARLCGLLETTVRDVMAKRHAFDMQSLLTPVSDAMLPASPEDAKVKEASEGIGANALRFLRMLPREGTLHFYDMGELESRADLVKGTGGRIVGNLYGRGLIARAKAKRGYTFAWGLTELGRALVVRASINGACDGEDG